MKVLFFQEVQDYTSGEKSYEAESVQCVRTLIDHLGDLFGAPFKEFLLGDDTCFILVNGSGTMKTGGLDTPLSSTDTVEVVPFVDAG